MYKRGFIKCRKCKQTKEKFLFPTSKSSKRGYSNTCVECYGNNVSKTNISIGDKFNMLTLISEPETTGAHRYGIFMCECGNSKRLRISHVTSNNKTGTFTKSCGCLLKDKEAVKKRTNNLIKKDAAYNYVLKMYKRHAEKRGYEFNLSYDYVKEIIHKPCFYCGNTNSNKTSKFINNISYNGIDRVNNSIGYHHWNCVPCCFSCNKMKMDLNIEDFIKKVTTIYLKFNKDETNRKSIVGRTKRNGQSNKTK